MPVIDVYAATLTVRYPHHQRLTVLSFNPVPAGGPSDSDAADPGSVSTAGSGAGPFARVEVTSPAAVLGSLDRLAVLCEPSAMTAEELVCRAVANAHGYRLVADGAAGVGRGESDGPLNLTPEI